jgi:hypothetical protein
LRRDRRHALLGLRRRHTAQAAQAVAIGGVRAAPAARAGAPRSTPASQGFGRRRRSTSGRRVEG